MSVRVSGETEGETVVKVYLTAQDGQAVRCLIMQLPGVVMEANDLAPDDLWNRVGLKTGRFSRLASTTNWTLVLVSIIVASTHRNWEVHIATSARSVEMDTTGALTGGHCHVRNLPCSCLAAQDIWGIVGVTPRERLLGAYCEEPPAKSPTLKTSEVSEGVKAWWCFLALRVFGHVASNSELPLTRSWLLPLVAPVVVAVIITACQVRCNVARGQKGQHHAFCGGSAAGRPFPPGAEALAAAAARHPWIAPQ
jgi:hypothetical protein